MCVIDRVDSATMRFVSEGGGRGVCCVGYSLSLHFGAVGNCWGLLVFNSVRGSELGGLHDCRQTLGRRSNRFTPGLLPILVQLRVSAPAQARSDA